MKHLIKNIMKKNRLLHAFKLIALLIVIIVLVFVFYVWYVKPLHLIDLKFVFLI